MKRKTLINIFTISLVLVGGIAIGSLSTTHFLKKDPVSSEQNVVENKNDIENDEDIIFESEAQACYRTQDPYDLFELSEVVLIGEYQKDVSTKMYGIDPYTSYEFKIEKILKNSNNRILNDTVIALSLGGTISLDEYLKVRGGGDGFKEKLGISDMSPQELSTKKIKISLASNGDKNFDESPTRLLFINYDPQYGEYVIAAGRAGMSSYNEETKQIFDTVKGTYINVSFLK